MIQLVVSACTALVEVCRHFLLRQNSSRESTHTLFVCWIKEFVHAVHVACAWRHHFVGCTGKRSGPARSTVVYVDMVQIVVGIRLRVRVSGKFRWGPGRVCPCLGLIADGPQKSHNARLMPETRSLVG